MTAYYNDLDEEIEVEANAIIDSPPDVDRIGAILTFSAVDSLTGEASPYDLKYCDYSPEWPSSTETVKWSVDQLAPCVFEDSLIFEIKVHMVLDPGAVPKQTQAIEPEMVCD